MLNNSKKKMMDIDTAMKMEHMIYGHGVGATVADRIKHLEKVGIYETDKIITISPQIFVYKKYLYDEDYELDWFRKLKLVKSKSRCSVQVRNLSNQKVRDFQDLKIRQPYPNEKYIVAGTTINRKFYHGMSFVPDDDDFCEFLNGSTNYLFKERYDRRGLRLYDLCYSEYQEHNHNSTEKLYDTISIGENSDKRSAGMKSYIQFMSQKYMVAPFEITERWQLCYEEDGKIGYTEEIIKTSIVHFLRYRPDYLKKQEEKEVICESGIYGSMNHTSIKFTKFGKVYEDNAITSLLIQGNIGEELKIAAFPDKNEYPYQRELEYGESDVTGEKAIFLRNENQIVISMIPIIE